MKLKQNMDIIMFAACGMNCNVCYRYCNTNKPCAGCLVNNTNKTTHCRNCKIKDCTKQHNITYCYECFDFPCKLINNLEKSYLQRYQTSLIENSKFVKENGRSAFMELQTQQFTCSYCGGIISLHDQECSECKRKINYKKTA